MKMSCIEGRLLLAGHGDGEESEEDIVRSVSKGGYYVGGDTATPVHSHTVAWANLSRFNIQTRNLICQRFISQRNEVKIGTS